MQTSFFTIFKYKSHVYHLRMTDTNFRLICIETMKLLEYYQIQKQEKAFALVSFRSVYQYLPPPHTHIIIRCILDNFHKTTQSNFTKPAKMLHSFDTFIIHYLNHSPITILGCFCVKAVPGVIEKLKTNININNVLLLFLNYVEEEACYLAKVV